MAGDKKKRFGIERKPEPAPERAPEPAPERAPEPAPERAPEPAPERAPEPAPERAPERKPVYRVAKGHTLIVKRGVLYPGQVVTVADFGGVEENLLALIESGHVAVKG